MMKRQLFSIVLVLITVLITNFAFALSAKDAFVPATNHEMITMDSAHHTAHNNHHSSDNLLSCEVHCNALMMSCSAGISEMHNANLHIALDASTKITDISDDSLYSIDLAKDHKPPIFS